MIECKQCKARIPASATRCQQCGADLRPGLGRTNRIVVIVSGVIGTLVLAVPAILILRHPMVVSGRAPAEATWLGYGMLLGAGLFLAFALYRSRRIPDAVRNATRGLMRPGGRPEG